MQLYAFDPVRMCMQLAQGTEASWSLISPFSFTVSNVRCSDRASHTGLSFFTICVGWSLRDDPAAGLTPSDTAFQRDRQFTGQTFLLLGAEAGLPLSLSMWRPHRVMVTQLNMAS